MSSVPAGGYAIDIMFEDRMVSMSTIDGIDLNPLGLINVVASLNASMNAFIN